MSRYHFPSSARDTSPLLPSNSDDVSLHDLSPRPFRSPIASPSPPPSFYRTQNNRNLSSSPGHAKSTTVVLAGPPPPVTASTQASRLQQDQATVRSVSRLSSSSGWGAGTTVRGTHPFFGLQRREKAIHEELQSILDAQSAGLLRGFGGNLEVDGGSDTCSRTPTTRSVREDVVNSGIKPVRQPKKKRIGLKKARVALLEYMQELIGIKQNQNELLAAEIVRREKILRQVKLWEKRMEAARAQLGRYSENLAANAGDEEARVGGTGPGGTSDAEGMRILEFQSEEQAVEHEIRELEDRLAQMKAKRSWLREQIKECVNKREATLSSYRGALREVETEVKGFLERPPLTVSIVELEGQSFMALPPKRRTLSMAKDWWSQELGELEVRRHEVNEEAEALEEGASMWQESVETVMKFEDDLRRQIANPVVQEAEILAAQCESMNRVIELLGRNAELAEKRGWNLLICAVGAELAAFHEGQGILRAALGEEAKGKEGQNGEDLKKEGVTNHRSDTAEEPNDLPNGLNREESSEDEGPNLNELLMDHGASEEID